MLHERVRCILVESACSRSTCAAPRHMPLAFIHLMHQPARLHAGPVDSAAGSPGRAPGPGPRTRTHMPHRQRVRAARALVGWVRRGFKDTLITEHTIAHPEMSLNKPWNSSVAKFRCLLLTRAFHDRFFFPGFAIS